MPLHLWLAFVAASAVLLVIPGPTILTVISYSVAHGRRANAPLVAAVALGDSTALVVSLLGRLRPQAFITTHFLTFAGRRSRRMHHRQAINRQRRTWPNSRASPSSSPSVGPTTIRTRGGFSMPTR